MVPGRTQSRRDLMRTRLVVSYIHSEEKTSDHPCGAGRQARCLRRSPQPPALTTSIWEPKRGHGASPHHFAGFETALLRPAPPRSTESPRACELELVLVASPRTSAERSPLSFLTTRKASPSAQVGPGHLAGHLCSSRTSPPLEADDNRAYLLMKCPHPHLLSVATARQSREDLLFIITVDS